MKYTLRVVIALLLVAAPIWAHHGSTGYDQKKPVHLVGKVSGLDWFNPHVVVHLDVAGPDGKVTTWLVNSFPPNAGTRAGYSRSTFAAGTEITVDGYQALDGSNRVNPTSIVFKDGKKISSPDCFDTPERCFRPTR
jgi:hypothetical protein